jgi:ketosteroid isomerase-like protein
MSEENVEVVRRAWEAYHRRDNEAALALYDPTIEIDPTEQTGIDAGVYRGLEGVQDFFRTGWAASVTCELRSRSGSTLGTKSSRWSVPMDAASAAECRLTPSKLTSGPC